jgi:hypothetical protein
MPMQDIHSTEASDPSATSAWRIAIDTRWQLTTAY